MCRACRISSFQDFTSSCAHVISRHSVAVSERWSPLLSSGPEQRGGALFARPAFDGCRTKAGGVSSNIVFAWRFCFHHLSSHHHSSHIVFACGSSRKKQQLKVYRTRSGCRFRIRMMLPESSPSRTNFHETDEEAPGSTSPLG